ncbi:phosphatase PAP2 family protein [Candidatus Wolfebacteria bacterium]|nr:phosphatase PAP2 family protein [Candidatus Wolfebacteria bacterium]
MIFDYAAFGAIHGFAEKFLLLDWAGIFLARFLPYAIVLVGLIIFFRIKNWRHRVYFLAVVLLAVILARGLLTEVIRVIYERPRPFIALGFNPLISHESGNSFPSGHASAFFALAGSIFLFLRRYPEYGRREAIWLFIAATLVGLGRVFVGVHWPSDVAAGAIIGVISAYAVFLFVPKPESMAESHPARE